MFEITDATWLAENVKRFKIKAPRIARKQQPGQFVIVRIHEHGERIPLTIADSDPDAGTITLIVQGVGKTTRLMNSLSTGEFVLDVVGPLGKPSENQLYGNVAVVAGGVGTAIVLPIARALTQAGNYVVAIQGARTRSLIILEDELRSAVEDLFITTDDGSYGQRGMVTDQLQRLIAARHIDMVLAVGPIPMMRGVAEVTRPHGIPTTVSLNSIMIDGTGMCGGCRVIVGGEPRFACVDGPEFDAHLVDFDILCQRNAMYHASEQESLQRYQAHPETDRADVDALCRLAAQHPELIADGE